MKVKIAKRSGAKKGEAKQLRDHGQIPAVIYKKGAESETVAVTRIEFEALLRKVKKGHLSTQRFTLVDEKGVEKKALLKDVQYHPTNYEVTHLDFEELISGNKVKLSVPVECVGVNQCVGVRLGGVLRHLMHQVQIECLPEAIPESFEVDVKNMEMGQVKRLSDLQIPESIHPLAPMNEVVVSVGKG